MRRAVYALTLLLAGAALTWAVLDFAAQRGRAKLLSGDPHQLERLGRRLIVGYRDFADMKTLVERRAVAGVFITSRNVAGRSADAVAADVRALQDIRSVQGLPNLVIAADQEGGPVSRLSPPLPHQPTLAQAISGLTSDADRETAVRAYAGAQAVALKALGVSLNFAPVVDLTPAAPFAETGSTQIGDRAISADPETVANVASWYCDELVRRGVGCTLKHFPGLGRIANDTHVSLGVIDAEPSLLEATDWVPFRRAMGRDGVAVMLGHVRLDALDGTAPASHSEAIVDGVVRKAWAFDGLLLTDDIGMGAIADADGGAGRAAVEALNAGVDLVLIANEAKHFDTVMAALLDADARGEIGKEREADAKRRVEGFVGKRAGPAEPARSDAVAR